MFVQKLNGERRIGSGVYTPLGKGVIVHQLKNGSFVVEFEHGGGEIFSVAELMGKALCLDPFCLEEER